MRAKTYRMILKIQAGILSTLVLHKLATVQRGYNAIGGEFLAIPLLFIIYRIGQALKERWEITNEHFKKKEEVKVWKEEGRQNYAK